MNGVIEISKKSAKWNDMRLVPEEHMCNMCDPGNHRRQALVLKVQA